MKAPSAGNDVISKALGDDAARGASLSNRIRPLASVTDGRERRRAPIRRSALRERRRLRPLCRGATRPWSYRFGRGWRRFRQESRPSRLGLIHTLAMTRVGSRAVSAILAILVSASAAHALTRPPARYS